MSQILEWLTRPMAGLWQWVRKTPHLSGVCTLLAVGVVLFLQSRGFHEQFDDSPRNAIEWSERKGWVPPTEAILWLKFLVPYLGIWLVVGGVVFHLAMLRALGNVKRMVRPVWVAALFLAGWAVASDLSEHLVYLEISFSGEPATPISYNLKLVMIAMACLLPAVGLHLYARASLLNRYTARNFLGPAAFCFVAFASLWVLMDLLDSLKDFQEARIPLSKILMFYMSMLPFIFVSVAPAAILLGVLYALTKMSRANEIVSMLTAGRSVAQVLAPVFSAALLASLMSLAANYYWAPRAEGNRKAMMRALTEKQAGTIMAEGLMFRNAETRRTWYAGSFPFNLREEKIRNIEVREEDGNGDLTRTWVARSAVWWPNVKVWRFFQGHEVTYKNGKPESMRDFTGRLPGSVSKMDVSGIEETPWSIVSSALVPDFMGVPDIVSYVAAHGDTGTVKLAPFRTHLHHRFAFPFHCLVLALVAAPLGIAYSRRGSLGGIAVSIFIFFGMIFVNDVFLNLGKGGHLPPHVAPWIPNAGFALVGGLMLYLRSQNKELPKFSLKPAKVMRSRRQSAPATTSA